MAYQSDGREWQSYCHIEFSMRQIKHIYANPERRKNAEDSFIDFLQGDDSVERNHTKRNAF